MKSLFVFAAATAAALTSAAFATPGPGSDSLHQAQHAAAGRLATLMDDQAMMCQVPEVPRDQAASPRSGPALRIHPGA